MAVAELQSPRDRRWTVRGAYLADNLPVRERLLLLRGLPPGAERDLFLHPRPHANLGRLLGDPTTLPDCARAADRVAEAVNGGEPICVYGDYDADGVTATAILVRGLRRLGGQVEYYIPHRVREGFGLNEAAVRSVAQRGARLLVTVDCGTSNSAEAALVRELGMDLVITDHHAVPEKLPEAVAVVNPGRPEGSYPYRHLTGAGVAYTLLRAVAYRLGAGGGMPAGELLQLAAIGTVADVAPLTGENRLIVRAGLEYLNTGPLPGLRALAASAGLSRGEVTERDLAYKLGPRLNAAGRMEHAGLACDLLLEAEPAKARLMALELEELNSARRAATDEMLLRASELAHAGAARGDDVITVYHPEWSPALLGIVAGQIARLYSVPVVAATLDGEEVKASARSVPGLDIVRALDGCRHLLVQHGGHSQAAGFTTTLAGLQEVHEHLLAEFTGARRDALPEVDLELGPSDISPALSSDLTALAPFGSGNPEPLFGLRGARIDLVRVFGKKSNHLSFSIASAGGFRTEVVGWNMSSLREELVPGSAADLIVRPLRERDGRYTPLRFSLEQAFPDR